MQRSGHTGSENVLPDRYLRRTDATVDEARSLLERGEFFSPDLVRPTREHADELATGSGVDPEAVERALRFGEGELLDARMRLPARVTARASGEGSRRVSPSGA